jgi:hypothetical protein
MNKYLFIIFILLSFSLFAQNDLLNEPKYWVWRDRFVNELVQIQKIVLQ